MPEQFQRWADWLRLNQFDDLFHLDMPEALDFASLDWNPSDADRRAAWAFYTELRTRIATQRLRYQEGDEATALQSIFRLFGLSRTIIKEHDRCTHFATLTVTVMNEHVRPFTARWHRKNVAGRVSSADERFIFRQELSHLQKKLSQFSRLLGLLAGDPLASQQPHATQLPVLNQAIRASIPFGIREGQLGKRDPADINTKERQAVCERRRRAGAANWDTCLDAAGLALSGGGIRSATFALGVLQTLARRGILNQIDLLSTVSGGGYLGSFLSSFLNSDRIDVDLKPQADHQPFGTLTSDESRAVRRLRNHSKYLTEGGLRTTLTIIAFVAYGLLASLLLIAAPLLWGVVIASAPRFATIVSSPPPFSAIASPLLFLLKIFAVATLAYPLAQKIFDRGRMQKMWPILCISLGCACAVLLAVDAIPYLMTWLHRHGTAEAMGIVAAAAIVLGSLGILLGPSTIAGRISFALFGLAGPSMLLLAFFLLTEIFILDRAYGFDCLLILAVLVTLYTGTVLNINFASPHLYYRNRLARTYLTRLNQQGDVEMQDPQKLSEMNAAHKAPYHIINAALNIPASDDPDLRGRRTDFFWFSKYYCGSPITGFLPTAEWERVDRHLDLGTAMAISGAAAAPHMGTLTSRRYTFLLAMLNVRLGYWLRRPDRWPMPLANLINFLRELTGWMKVKHRYLNVSDGGHIENLGIYELLRRRCKFIIAVDGEADARRTFGGLLTVTQFASIDLGVRIEPDLADLRMDATGNGRAHFGISRIEYPGGDCGLLLYIKSSLTGNESEFLKKYHAENPDFPHQSTANQLYTETQFEAYRALGEHIADDLFRTDLIGEGWNAGLSVRDWFQRLAASLLNDPSCTDS